MIPSFCFSAHLVVEQQPYQRRGQPEAPSSPHLQSLQQEWSQSGHNMFSCPKTPCIHCNKNGHVSTYCPTAQEAAHHAAKARVQRRRFLAADNQLGAFSSSTSPDACIEPAFQSVGITAPHRRSFIERH